MAKWIRVAAAAVVSLMLVLLFGDVLTAYYRPMEDKAYNLSMGDWEGEAVPDDWVYDQKGWTVFTQEGRR